MRTVLIVSGGGFQGMALIEALRRVPQTRIVIADCYEENLGRYHATRFIRAPLLKDEEAFLLLIEQICQEESVDLVIPATELELDVLSRFRDRLERTGATVMVSDSQVLSIGQDKLLLHDWLVTHGLPALPTAVSPMDLGLPLPIFGKPRAGWGGKGSIALRSASDLEHALKSHAERMVWQPLLEHFSEISVDFSIDARGSISRLAARSRLRTLAGFSLIGQPVSDRGIDSIARRVADLLASMGGRGVFNLQFLCKGDDRWVSDLNPRVGTSMPLSLAAGHNPVAFLLGVEEPPLGSASVSRVFRVLSEKVVPELHLTDVRGVVLDLDDTLLDQKDWICRKLDGTWQGNQLRLPSRVEFLQVGIWLLEEGHRADLIDAICLQFCLPSDLRMPLIETYRAFRPASCRLFDDVKPVLAELRRRGYRLALLTDNPASSQRQKIEVAGLSSLFDGLTFTDDLRCLKPDSRAFEAACASIQLFPQSAVMVGDNFYRDAVGALEAGLAHAFQIHHDGAMFNFSSRLNHDGLSGSNITRIGCLNELLWYLPEVST